MQYAPATKWTFVNEKGETEEVKLERWIWAVVYADGTELVQFDKQGTFHQFTEINQEEVERFTMVNTEDTSKQYSILISSKMKIFHFYKQNLIRHQKDGETVSTERFTSYVFGYQHTHTGESMYHHILLDDRLMITADRDYNPTKVT